MSEDTFATTEAMKRAWRLIENTGVNVFLTGRAGTGKTTFLRKLGKNTTKRAVVVAPTGIAAINAGGVTIHSFFQLPLSPFVPGNRERHIERMRRDKLKLIQALDLLIIDEISMVRADLLDAIDDVLRRRRHSDLPFGGVQLLMIGDLQQLAPVTEPRMEQLLAPYYDSPYFFSSSALRRSGFATVEFSEVFRQASDREFLNLLNCVRTNTLDTETLRKLNSRYISDFNPRDEEGYIRLTTHNAQADAINNARLAALPGKEVVFKATVSGDFSDSSYPAEPELCLKPGARVMFLRNSPDHQYYNGMMGSVMSANSEKVTVQSDNGQTVELITVMWENCRYTIDPETGEVRSQVAGTFSQLPLRLAWAVTIHKSQGLTFDRAIVDASRSFAHGQTYVALSRCRTLGGLVLGEPLRQSAVISDPRILNFTNAVQSQVIDEETINEYERDFAFGRLDRLFSLTGVLGEFDSLLRVVGDAHASSFPRLFARYSEFKEKLQQLSNVAQRFAAQYHAVSPDSPRLTERVSSGCTYFAEQLAPLCELLKDTPGTCDNKEVSRRLSTRLDEFSDLLNLHIALLRHFATIPFTVTDYMNTRARLLAASAGSLKSKKKSPAKKAGPKASPVPKDVENPQVYAALTDWRTTKCTEADVPAFVVMGNRTLVEIANRLPKTREELSAVPGIGRMKLEAYGDELLKLLRPFTEGNS